MSQIEQAMRASIAGEVRAAMARRQISATALADATGIPTSTLSRKLNAHSDFSVGELVRITMFLGVDPGSLMAAATAQQVAS